MWRIMPPDTFRFYNPETDKVFLSRDVTKWLEWHGRIAGMEDMERFEPLEATKKSSIIPEIDVTDQPLDEDGPPLFPLEVNDEFQHNSIPSSLLQPSSLKIVSHENIADEVKIETQDEVPMETQDDIRNSPP
jgi:hypothetical protein